MDETGTPKMTEPQQYKRSREARFQYEYVEYSGKADGSNPYGRKERSRSPPGEKQKENVQYPSGRITGQWSSKGQNMRQAIHNRRTAGYRDQKAIPVPRASLRMI
jgi:hypothetical protein